MKPSDEDVRAVKAQRIMQRAIDDLAAWIVDGTVPGGPIYVRRGVVAVHALAAAAGAQIGGLCAGREDLAAGVKTAGKVMLQMALQELGRRAGTAFAVAPDEAPAGELEAQRQAQLQRWEKRALQMRTALEQATAALRSAELVMAAVPPLLHTHQDPELARIGQLSTERGVLRAVRAAAEFAQLSLEDRSPTTLGEV